MKDIEICRNMYEYATGQYILIEFIITLFALYGAFTLIMKIIEKFQTKGG